MTTYLCSTGTSATRNLGPGINEKWVQANGGIENATRKILDSFQDYAFDDEEAWQKHLSAEIHSLARMGLTAKDQVFLFASNTDDGKACANAVANYLIAKLPGLACQVQVIDGLQVYKENEFRTQGVVNYVKTILSLIETYHAGQCVLNPTGGFKALVPYTALIGMIKRVRTKYIFERSNKLLELPPYPIEFALGRIELIQALMTTIQNNTSVSLSDYEQALKRCDQNSHETLSEELKPLFEIENDQVTLSAVGFLIYDELMKPAALTPFLSRQALNGLLKLQQRDDCNPEAWLQRVSRSDKSFQQSKHANLGNGFYWLNYGHTADRYLVSKEGWKLLVWKIVDHQEYDRLSSTVQLSQQLMRERRAKYAPFLRMELVY